MFFDRFEKFLISVLVVVGISLLFVQQPVQQPAEEGFVIHFFFSPTCPHCKEQHEFNEQLTAKYGVKFVYHDVTRSEEAALFRQKAQEAGIDQSRLGVPLTIFNGNTFLGFSETTAKEIEAAITKTKETVPVEKKTPEQVTLPFIGEIKIADYSLPALAIILGLVDGFNPCAMWALVFLIGLVIGLKDYRKLWLLVGSFVFASGVLYFLFMTAWLNVFLFIGYFRPLIIIIGLSAIYFAISNLRSFMKKELVCPLPGVKKQRLIERMKQVVTSPITIASIIGIIALAFVINSIEFVCSSFIPAIYTQTLALAELSKLQYYGYILLYDFFFMLDDLVIFSLAAFAVTKSGDKYAKWCKLIGGIILLALGLILLFAPSWLQ